MPDYSTCKGKRRAEKTKNDRQQKLISISPSPKGGNEYIVTPKNVIGAIELSTKVLIIQPKISVKNILFLLCYSWEPLDWSTSFDLFKETNDKIEGLANAIVSVFTQKVGRAFRKGILQGYRFVMLKFL
jgi:hypothetical protein